MLSRRSANKKITVFFAIYTSSVVMHEGASPRNRPFLEVHLRSLVHREQQKVTKGQTIKALTQLRAASQASWREEKPERGAGEVE